jgi:RNase P subunit RPR2
MEKVCIACSAPFVATGSGSHWRNYCDDCNTPEAHVQRKRVREAARHRVGPVEVQCQDCGVTFTAEGHGSGKRKFCDDCLTPEAKRRRRATTWIDVERVCQFCGKTFVAPSRPHNRLYCDDCRGRSGPARSERRRNAESWDKKSPEEKLRHAAAQKRWADRNPEKVKVHSRRTRLKLMYGLTIEQVEQMHVDQGGCCAICDQSIELWARTTHIDHCHDSKRVRGLLCEDCNRGLGCFKDSVDSLRKAVDYLG